MWIVSQVGLYKYKYGTLHFYLWVVSQHYSGTIVLVTLRSFLR